MAAASGVPNGPAGPDHLDPARHRSTGHHTLLHFFNGGSQSTPDHRHFDLRFLFRTDADVAALQAEEVLDHSWQPAGRLTAEPLRSRLLAVPSR